MQVILDLRVKLKMAGFNQVCRMLEMVVNVFRTGLWCVYAFILCWK